MLTMFIDILHDINQYNEIYITVVLLLFDYFSLNPSPQNRARPISRIFKRVVEFKIAKASKRSKMKGKNDITSPLVPLYSADSS